VKQLDLADLRSIHALAADLAATLPCLDLLTLNAGVMAVRPKQLTKDGFEMQMGVNHIGHFYLAQRLLPLMNKVSGLAATQGLHSSGSSGGSGGSSSGSRRASNLVSRQSSTALS
jgi:NAD(P)-dependent dehydrogenase (short-subunit alcohol dehydrogenase family)